MARKISSKMHKNNFLRKCVKCAILSGSNLLLLEEVREAAGEVLGQLIDHNNVLHIMSLARTFSCREVESKAHNFLLERFEMVNNTEEFLKLAHYELATYLAMDDIIVKSEETIFDAILRWVEVEPDTRSQYFDSLVTHVRFALISGEYCPLIGQTNSYCPLIGQSYTKTVISLVNHKNNVLSLVHYTNTVNSLVDLRPGSQHPHQEP